MSRKRIENFICQKCDTSFGKWLGKCTNCQEWNTIVESAGSIIRSKLSKKLKVDKVKLLSEISTIEDIRIKTGIGEFDRVLGGGITPASVTLIGGEPGVGKSTLLLEVASKISLSLSASVLYVSGEESELQIAKRAQRLKVDVSGVYILHESSWVAIKEEICSLKPAFLILDSIQTSYSEEVQSAPGTMTQVREVTFDVMSLCKSSGLSAFIIGHVTKDGVFAGPKILEHMVDTAIYFEGDLLGQYRMLRGVKNRFGNVNEIGIFEMSDSGLNEVKNPSRIFLEDQSDSSVGSSLSTVREGSRVLVVEIQALVVENKSGMGRRNCQGFDNNRLAMLLAVIEKYISIPMGFYDVYVNVVGGVKLNTHESDLSVLASILSSIRKVPLTSSTIYMGEVGLTGEVRSVPFFESRIKELSHLKYNSAFVPGSEAKKYANKYSMKLKGLKKAEELEAKLFQ